MMWPNKDVVFADSFASKLYTVAFIDNGCAAIQPYLENNENHDDEAHLNKPLDHSPFLSSTSLVRLEDLTLYSDYNTQTFIPKISKNGLLFTLNSESERILAWAISDFGNFNFVEGIYFSGVWELDKTA